MPWPQTTPRVVLGPMFDTDGDESPVTDPFQDDAPLGCGLENPEVCESCQ